MVFIYLSLIKHSTMRILIMFILFLSCSKLQQNEKRKKIARVNSIFLSKSDLENEINAELSDEDSIVMSRSIINKWAINNLV